MESLSTYLKASKSELPFTTASTFSLLTWRFLLPVLKHGSKCFSNHWDKRPWVFRFFLFLKISNVSSSRRLRELTTRSRIFHGPVSPRCLLWQNWSRNYFLPRASVAVSRLVCDGLIFRTRAPETTLMFYKHDLRNYWYTLHTMRT